jgi:hypothetical protein
MSGHWAQRVDDEKGTGLIALRSEGGGVDGKRARLADEGGKNGVQRLVSVFVLPPSRQITY